MSGAPRLVTMCKLYAHCMGRWSEDGWNATDAMILNRTIDEFSDFDDRMAKLEKRFGEDYSEIRTTYGEMRETLQQIAAQPVPWPGFRRGATVEHRAIGKAEDVGGSPDVGGDDLAKQVAALSPAARAELMIKVAQSKPGSAN